MNNLAMWDSVQQTDPAFTKNFTKGGGFSGTSINATYLAKKATETFGSIGIGWGVDIENEDYIEGHIIDPETGQKASIHCLRIKLWYKSGDEIGCVYHFGQTTFIGKNKFGLFCDEEAPKKSLTDATTKALSMLGFGSDIFMGLYDDQQYREEVTEKSLLDNADDKDAEKARIQQEYIEWRKTHIDLVKTAVTRAELKTLNSLMVRKMSRYNDQVGLGVLEESRKESLTRIEGVAA
jgi:hypothetical protein